MGNWKMPYDAVSVTVIVTETLENLNIPYLIGGSLASTLHGMVRTTQDSDIVADLSRKDVHPFVTALQDDFYIDDEMIAGAIAHHSSFNIIHRKSMFKVDIFISRQRNFDRTRFSRARWEILSQDPKVGA